MYVFFFFCKGLTTTSSAADGQSTEEIEIKNAELNEEDYNYNLINEVMEKSGIQDWYADADALLNTLLSSSNFLCYFSTSNLYNIFLKVLSSQQTSGVFGLMYGSIPITTVKYLTNDYYKLPEYKMDDSSIFLKLSDTGVVLQLILGICSDVKVLNLLQKFKRVGNNKNLGTLKIFTELINILGNKTQEIKLKQLKQEEERVAVAVAAAASDTSSLNESNCIKTRGIFCPKWKHTIIRGMDQLSVLWNDNFWMGVDLTVDKIFDIISTSEQTLLGFSSRSLAYYLKWLHKSIQSLSEHNLKQLKYLFGIWHFIHLLFHTMKELKTSINQSLPIV